MQSYFFLPLLVSIATTQTCFESADRWINGRCFKLINQQLSYQEARTWCHNHQTYLATVPDITTDTYLASYAKTSFNEDYGSFWIGATRYNTSSKWQWDDGTPFVWSHFETQNLNFASESIKNGKWNTYTADKRLNFVCSYDPNGSPGTTDPPRFTTTPEASNTEGTATPSDATFPTTITPPSCRPISPTTFLFAYSNDLDSNIVKNTWNKFGDGQGVNSRFTTIASVRFDVKEEEEIVFSSDYRTINASIYSHLPDPSQSFPDGGTGSDVLRMIDRFLNHTDQPLCGSTIYILLKRYPIETEISNLVAKMRLYHSTVHVLVSMTPSGEGGQPKTMYNLATLTNGICIFGDDSSLEMGAGIISNDYLVFAVNPEVSGNGSLKLPNLVLNYSGVYTVHLTVQNHGPLDDFESLHFINYRINRTEISRKGFANFFYDSANFLIGLTRTDIEYQYLDNVNQVLQIRVYGKSAPSQWYPYDKAC